MPGIVRGLRSASNPPATVTLPRSVEIRPPRNGLVRRMAPNLADLPSRIDRFTAQRSQQGEVAPIIKSVKDGKPRYVISTEQVDLVGDIVVQQGLKPVSPRIPAQVDHSGHMRDLIGWWSDIETKGRQTLATLNLFEPGLTRMADMVRALHDAGMRMAASIGFVPDLEDGGYELLRDKTNDFVTGIKFLRSTLVEASVVVVPANPGALSVRSYEIAKRFGMTAERFDTFVVTDSSQRLLRGMRGHDVLARAAAAVQKADVLLKGGKP